MDLAKARSSVAAARLCLEHGHADSAVSRAYYAMFQGAQAALGQIGFDRTRWSHAGLQATFANELTRRRKRLPKILRTYLNEALDLRITADYGLTGLSVRQAARVVGWAEEFLARVGGMTQDG